MNEDIIRMAWEAGFEIDCCSLEWHDRIKRFFHAAFAAGAAAEREACAKVCEELMNKDDSYYSEFSRADDCAEAIRARGQK